MTIALIADAEQGAYIINKFAAIDWQWVFSIKDLPANAAAIFILKEGLTIDFSSIEIPIFINSVSTTLAEMRSPENVLRLNGWKGFLARPVWEVAGKVTDEVKNIFVGLNKQFIVVPDKPGFIAARVVAMIINEAWFALEAAVSTKAEIDTAMKLGTNYPYGPFEWGAIIGTANILQLLQKLSNTNHKYLPAPLLIKNNHS